MSQELQAGQIVPESGIYRVTHHPVHADAATAVTFIRGRRFPTCPSCDKISFTLVYSDEAYGRIRAAQRAEDRRSRQGQLRKVTRIPAAILTSVTALASLLRKRQSLVVATRQA